MKKTLKFLVIKIDCLISLLCKKPISIKPNYLIFKKLKLNDCNFVRT